jgi:hypothetical protein
MRNEQRWKELEGNLTIGRVTYLPCVAIPPQPIIISGKKRKVKGLTAEDRELLKKIHNYKVKVKEEIFTHSQKNQWKVITLRSFQKRIDKGEVVIDKCITLFKGIEITKVEDPERARLHLIAEELMIAKFLYTPISDWDED